MMQQAPPAPAPPAPPSAVAAPEASQTAAQLFQGPALTRQQREAVRERRSELSNQLTSAVERRQELVQELAGQEGAARAGLEARLQVLDNRIVRLEQDIEQTGRVLTNASLPQGTTQAPFAPARTYARDDAVMFAFIGGFVLLLPLVIAFARRYARGGSPGRDTQQDQRLERIEHAVDAIAIEVERISEAQRYSARLLTEGARPAETLDVREREPVLRQGRD